MPRFLAAAALCLCLAAAQAVRADQQADGDDARPAASTIALATIAPGDIYWQRFGHNTLVVQPPGGEGISYNFGYFDFEQPDFLRRFLLGRMLYQALAIPARLDLDSYVREDRTVHLQTLALTPAQAERLAADLARSVQPDNRDYLYEYFRANCSTRLRDALDAVLDGRLHQQTRHRSRGLTYRMHAIRLAQDDFWLGLGIDLGLGPDTDRALSFWEEMFIPELMRGHLREVRNHEGQPLVAWETTWHQGGLPGPADHLRDRRLPFAAVGIASALALLWLSARARRGGRAADRGLRGIAFALHLLFGLAGALLLFLWLGTDHVAAHRNENLFLLSPLSLLLAPFWPRRRAAATPAATAGPHRIGRTAGTVLAWLVAASAALGLLGKTIPFLFIQANLHWCLLLLPIHLALLSAWLRPRPNGLATRPA